MVAAGTGNLLAHSLDLPSRRQRSTVALQMHTRVIDLIKLTVDDRRSEHFAVMAGTGMDAMIMDETNPDLKKVIGPGAYSLPQRLWAGCRSTWPSASTAVGSTADAP